MDTTPQHDRPTPGSWASYAIGLIADLRFGPDIVRYLEQIEATLEPFDGRFLVHGGMWTQVEGDEIGAPVVIGFPTAAGATQWYRSEAYQRIARLRTDHSHSRVLITDGVDASHRAVDILTDLDESSAGR